jgi:hypothetical protein
VPAKAKKESRFFIDSLLDSSDTPPSSSAVSTRAAWVRSRVDIESSTVSAYDPFYFRRSMGVKSENFGRSVERGRDLFVHRE